MKIGIISDTHSYIDNEIMDYFRPVDEIWHAGDIGDMEIVKILKAFKPLMAVHGNIDDFRLRSIFPEDQVFMREGIKIFITHIGGYPGRYERGVKKKLQIAQPGLFVCGHSHILKVMSDKTIDNMLCVNPGAAGHAGFHVMRTIIRMDIQAGDIKDLEVIELGKRGKIKPALNKAGS